MRAEKNSKTKPRKRTVTKALKLTLVLIVVMIVLVVLLVPAFISSEKGRRMILARINGAITGRADFADLSMSWFKGIKVANLSFNDHAGRVSVEVGQVSAKPAYGSILMGNLSLGKTVIDKPRVEVNLADLRGKPSVTTGRPRAVPVESRSVALPIETLDLVLGLGQSRQDQHRGGDPRMAQAPHVAHVQISSSAKSIRPSCARCIIRRGRKLRTRFHGHMPVHVPH